jgi:predicted Zn-dependent protease with MMP-like domain
MGVDPGEPGVRAEHPRGPAAEPGEPRQPDATEPGNRRLAVDAPRFDELVADALDGIPEPLARAMSNVVVLTDDAHPEDPDLLGLYEGVPLTERTLDYAGMLPDRITLYREPLVAMCVDEAELVHEVRVTVVHEVAHHFGIDDAALHRLGWG